MTKLDGTMAFAFNGWVRALVDSIDVYDCKTNTIRHANQYSKEELLNGLKNGDLLIHDFSAVYATAFDGNTEIDDFDVDEF